MSSTSTTTLRTAAIWLCMLAALVLAACGGSSSSATGSTSVRTGTGAGATASTPTTGTGTTRTAASGAAIAYRKCLEAHGAGLPRLVLGPGGSVAGGHLAPPKGVSQATYDAAVKACGGAAGGQTKVSKAVTAFIDCMRANGVNAPAPGKNAGGLLSYLRDVNNPKFSPALKKCAGVLREGSGASP